MQEIYIFMDALLNRKHTQNIKERPQMICMRTRPIFLQQLLDRGLTNPIIHLVPSLQAASSIRFLAQIRRVFCLSYQECLREYTSVSPSAGLYLHAHQNCDRTFINWWWMAWAINKEGLYKHPVSSSISLAHCRVQPKVQSCTRIRDCINKQCQQPQKNHEK